MLEITGNHIAELNDEDLRSLVGMLCEAELRSKGISPVGVTWGGDQNAPDGGIDVRVEVSSEGFTAGFIPRPSTGYQVKKQDMPASAITKEMRPGGALRPVIAELAQSDGAYIIVSSAGTTSDHWLGLRHEAMSTAAQDLLRSANLSLDFYDRGRLATWVRVHPALSLWVREKIGQPLRGWRPYENWARVPGGIDEEYLLDEHVRFRGVGRIQEGMSALAGIVALQNELSIPATSVRLTGLSGVGKTRLVQALFDPRLSEHPLDPSLVFYTDIADSPTPDPRSLTDNLIALGTRSILVVDNCPPDLHRNLHSICATPGSQISLITIEYDVLADEPEETTVYRLEPSSTELIQKLIPLRFDYIGQVDASTIAEFSGGNARLAFALAAAVRRGESLAGLRDEELFRRIFIQRQGDNDTLLKSAEACSLVYSFDGETTEPDDAELGLLGRLANRPASELFRDISELRRRELMQSRGKWRAVLPHALANKLAQLALEDFPIDRITAILVQGGSNRLLLSFSRRLGYLHQSPAAVAMVTEWLRRGGLLGNVGNLNELGISILCNIAPVVPERVVEAIEQAAAGSDREIFLSANNVYCDRLVELLRQLAFDAPLFERCAELLVQFAISGGEETRSSKAKDALKSLSSMYLSGTRATKDQRLRFISSIIGSGSDDRASVGLDMLDAALQATHFTSHYTFDFGTRSRDYGYAPETNAELTEWFTDFAELAGNISASNGPLSEKAKKMLAGRFREIWHYGGNTEYIDRIVAQIVRSGLWPDGWLAVKATLHFDAEEMRPEYSERLRRLEQILAPRDLLENVRSYALSESHWAYDIDVDDEDTEANGDQWSRVENFVVELGAELASDFATLNHVLSDIVGSKGVRLFGLGRGLAKGATDPESIWTMLRDQLSATNADVRNFMALGGFLNSLQERDPKLAEPILDASLRDPTLSPRFPWLQASIRLNTRGLERLHQSLSDGIAPIWTYEKIGHGRVHEGLGDDEISALLRSIATKPDGLSVSIKILNMRFYGNRTNNSQNSPVLLATGRELCTAYEFPSTPIDSGHDDHILGELVGLCFVGEDSAAAAHALCRKIVEAISDYRIYSFSYSHLIRGLVKVQPLAVLNEIVGNNEIPIHRRVRALSSGFGRSTNPLNGIPDELLVKWCNEEPATRYTLIGSSIDVFDLAEDEGTGKLTPLAIRLVDIAPDPIALLEIFRHAIRPMSWSGSRSAAIEKRLDALRTLEHHPNPTVVQWLQVHAREFDEEVRMERVSEIARHQDKDERFE